jgi:hypothetical protein
MSACVHIEQAKGSKIKNKKGKEYMEKDLSGSTRSGWLRRRC